MPLKENSESLFRCIFNARVGMRLPVADARPSSEGRQQQQESCYRRRETEELTLRVYRHSNYPAVHEPMNDAHADSCRSLHVRRMQSCLASR